MNEPEEKKRLSEDEPLDPVDKSSADSFPTSDPPAQDGGDS
jgi:hypothetical protein